MGGPLQRERETAVLVDTEAAEAILRARVDGWGIPKERLCVFATAGPVAGMARLALDDACDWRRLESSVTQARPALVIVDSLSGAHRMDENSAEMRHLLLKLACLASDSRAAVLVVHHLRKRRRSDPDATSTERLRGSSTLAQLARCVWTIDRPDPNDPRRRLSQLKNNLVAYPPPIGFTIGAGGLMFGEAPAATRGATQAAQAAEFLEKILGDGPLAAAEIWRQTEECGFSRKAVFQGSHLLGVVKMRRTPTGAWLWNLPGRTPTLPW